jgi:hypothetical protein
MIRLNGKAILKNINVSTRKANVNVKKSEVDNILVMVFMLVVVEVVIENVA